MKHLLCHWLVLIIVVNRRQAQGWQSGVHVKSRIKARQYRLCSLHVSGDSDSSNSSNSRSNNDNIERYSQKRPARRFNYDLGIGKNKPLSDEELAPDGRLAEPLEVDKIARNWIVPEAVVKPTKNNQNSTIVEKRSMMEDPSFNNRNPVRNNELVKTRRMISRDNESRNLRGALWDELHYRGERKVDTESSYSTPEIIQAVTTPFGNAPPVPSAFYPDIDLSVPESVYSEDGSVDLVWDLLRWEAFRNQQEQYEPLLVSFLHSTILTHSSLESSLAFLLANRLQGMMISTQLQALIYETLQESPVFRRNLRADILAVRDRDPACNTLPDVFLYFKGFHALQSYRVANVLWNSGRKVLAQYLQSQVSQIFQIDIHPNATLGSGIMIDHGTGVVIGETATVGHNCSILHHVTLGGSGKKGVIRHPSVGNGVLLGAGATVLGPVRIGEGSQIGAGTLVIADIPPHCVAVGVPARIIGSFKDVTEQPSIYMNQIMDDRQKIITFESENI